MYYITQFNRVYKRKVIYRCGYYRCITMFLGRKSSRNVHPIHKSSPHEITKRIGIIGQNQLCHYYDTIFRFFRHICKGSGKVSFYQMITKKATAAINYKYMSIGVHTTSRNETKYLTYFALGWFVVNCLQAAFLNLEGDEAYYWQLSKNLDWSYFDHPPMVTVLIRLGELLGHGPVFT